MEDLRRTLISKDTLVPIGLVGVIVAGAVAWATQTSDIKYLKVQQEEQKNYEARITTIEAIIPSMQASVIRIEQKLDQVLANRK